MPIKRKVINLLNEEFWYPEKHASEIDAEVARRFNNMLAHLIIKVNNLDED